MNEEIPALKAEIRKLSARATAARMALHDLSEELPAGWTSIPDVARTAFEAFAALERFPT